MEQHVPAKKTRRHQAHVSIFMRTVCSREAKAQVRVSPIDFA